jgi:hypothetical protein
MSAPTLTDAPLFAEYVGADGNRYVRLSEEVRADIDARVAAHAEVTRLVANARRGGKESHHVAAAAALLALHRTQVLSLCCACVERHDKGRPLPSWTERLPRGGECSRCSYVGHDCLVVVPMSDAPGQLEGGAL